MFGRKDFVWNGHKRVLVKAISSNTFYGMRVPACVLLLLAMSTLCGNI